MNAVEELLLPEPASTLHQAFHATLAAHLGPPLAVDPDAGGPDLPGPDPAPPWSYGGGGVLAARWRHRRAHGLRLLVDPGNDRAAWPELPAPGLARACEARGGLLLRATPRHLQIAAAAGTVDIIADAPRVTLGHRSGLLNGVPAGLLPSACILAHILLHRGDRLPTRNLLDAAAAAVRDPLALECAVNTLPDPLRLRDAIRDGPAPAEGSDRTAAALVSDDFKPLLGTLRGDLAYTVDRCAYRAATVAARAGHRSVLLLERRDGVVTRVPFLHLAGALRQRGLHHRFTPPTAPAPPPGDDLRTTVLWGDPAADPRDVVERHPLAAEPEPPEPPPGPRLADLPALHRTGDLARLSWFVHAGGLLDLVAHTADGRTHVAARTRDPDALARELHALGLPLAALTGHPIRTRPAHGLADLVRVQRQGIEAVLAAHQNMER